MSVELVNLASQFGAPGLLLLFMVWDRKERNLLDKARTEADIKVATALTTLAERLNHVH